MTWRSGCPDDEQLAAWLDGALGADGRAAVDAHLARCDACRRVVAATVAPAEELSPGARWDRYVVLHVLGAGGMGVVYEAWDPELERRVALKVLRPGSPMERAQREAQALARITHPNVVSVHDVGVVAGQVFVVMELVAGEPLGGWARGRASGEVLDVLVQAGRGLAAAHAVGVVHRDVKPDNILVTRGGRAVVTDLGLARAPTAAPHPQAAVGSLTVTGTLLGTPAYMAPEQLAGQPAGARSDLFSFCVTAWEALYGERPFVGETVEALGDAIRGGRLPDVRGVARWRRARRALARGLAWDPALRPATMDDLLADLAPARPWWSAVIGAAAVGLAAAGLTAWAHDAPGRACARAGDPLDEVWGADARAQVERAFAEAGGPLADDARRAVVDRLDAWSGAWRDMRVDVCRGERVREDLPPEVAAVRNRCLDRRREELRALGRLLAAPEPDLPAIGPRAAWALPSVSRCADVEALLAPVPPPEDPEVRARLDGVEASLAEVAAVRDAGRYAAGLALAGPAAARADALGYPPLQAEALVLLADLQDRTGDYPAAAGSLRRAVIEAERGRDLRMAARALAETAWVVGHERADGEAGLDAAAHADALLQGLGGDLEIGALAAASRAAVLLDLGRPEDAEREERRVLEARLALHGESHPQVAMALVNLAASLVRQGRGDEGLALQERGVQVYAATIGDRHPLTVGALLNLADTERGVGRLADARAHAELGLLRAREALGAEHPLYASAENVAGLVALEDGRYAEAIERLGRAVAIAERVRGPEHPFVAHYGSALGEAMYRAGRVAEAAAWERRAVALYAGLGDDALRGRALYVLGLCEIAAGEREPGRSHLQEALGIAEREEPASPHREDVVAALAAL